MAEIDGGVSLAQVNALINAAVAAAGSGVSTAQMNTAISTAVGSLVIPVPATATPPGVTDSGAVGSQMPYARSDHTHASKARKSRVTGVNTSTYVWTFPTAFAAGVIPICNGIAEDPANSASDCYNVQIAGVPTNTQVTFRIIRQSSGLLGLLLGALSINPTPGTINLHCTAFEP